MSIQEAPTSAPTLTRLMAVGVWALPVYATLLAVSTLTHQPDYKADFAGYADYVTTAHFLASHVGASIFGGALGVVGIVSAAVLVALPSGRPIRTLLGASFSVIGNVINTAVFGVAAFTQPAIGRAYNAGFADIVQVNDDVYGAELIITAVVGLLFFMTGAVLLGGSIRATSPRLRLPGIAYATTIPLFVIAGFSFSTLQPVAAVALAAATAMVARRLPAVLESEHSDPR